jgi:hypothetical protein
LASLFMHSRHPNTTDAKRNGAACSVRCSSAHGEDGPLKKTATTNLKRIRSSGIEAMLVQNVTVALLE